jgi:Domain of unknown function (DUF4124)
MTPRPIDRRGVGVFCVSAPRGISIAMRIVRRPVAAPLQIPTHVALVWVSLALFTPALGAASICRWVDEAGRTQMADAVPDRYKHIATCTDSQKYELSAEQRRDAEQRAADEQSRAPSQADNRPATAASSARSPSGAASTPRVKRPVELVTEATDCPTWRRLYNESSDCFGPYRTARGGMKPEAFDNCNVVPHPDLKCGPLRN